jgi:hypothetical protein
VRRWRRPLRSTAISAWPSAARPTPAIARRWKRAGAGGWRCSTPAQTASPARGRGRCRGVSPSGFGVTRECPANVSNALPGTSWCRREGPVKAGTPPHPAPPRPAREMPSDDDFVAEQLRARRPPLTAERRLLLAILESAWLDLHQRRSERHRRDAVAWFASASEGAVLVSLDRRSSRHRTRVAGGVSVRAPRSLPVRIHARRAPGGRAPRRLPSR